MRTMSIWQKKVWQIQRRNKTAESDSRVNSNEVVRYGEKDSLKTVCGMW